MNTYVSEPCGGAASTPFVVINDHLNANLTWTAEDGVKGIVRRPALHDAKSGPRAWGTPVSCGDETGARSLRRGRQAEVPYIYVYRENGETSW
jgi:hypothetical protein